MPRLVPLGGEEPVNWVAAGEGAAWQMVEGVADVGGWRWALAGPGVAGTVWEADGEGVEPGLELVPLKVVGSMEAKCCGSGGEVRQRLDKCGDPRQVMRRPDDGGVEQRNGAARKSCRSMRSAAFFGPMGMRGPGIHNSTGL